MEQKKESMNIVIVGHVDHGKSTVIGRLLADTNSLPQGKLEFVKEKCRKESKVFEYAFLLDALKDEQNQGITIDSARCFFRGKNRDYSIIDAPGHIEFLRNMISGASRAEAALLVIDAKEGIQENSKRHGYLLSMLGISRIIVCVNKMDLVGYDKKIFEKIKADYSDFLKEIQISPIEFIPASAINGENIVSKSSNFDWYSGNTILSALDSLKKERDPKDKPFRMPVQDVYKFTQQNDARRIVAGRIESGAIKVGDSLLFLPSGKSSSISSIEEFSMSGKLKESAEAGYSTGFTLKEQIYIPRGEMACKHDEKLPIVGSEIKARVFWIGKNPMEYNKDYFLKMNTVKVPAKLKKIIKSLDASSLNVSYKSQIDKNEVAECVISLMFPIAFDIYSEMQNTGRFVIVDGYDISGGGIIIEELNRDIAKKNIFWHTHKITRDDRNKIMHHKSALLWLTGLSGAGKSTIASLLQEKLFAGKKMAYILDGDNIRHGLNEDLGFSENDRCENIRRIGEVAKLFVDAGFITIASFISPYRRDRDNVRKSLGDDFVEIYIKCPLEECEKRDVKGLYKKARAGELKEFTGVSAPYEEPSNPEMIIDTKLLSPSQAADAIYQFMKEKNII